MLESTLWRWCLAAVCCWAAGLLATAVSLGAPAEFDPSFGLDGEAFLQTNLGCLPQCIGSEGSYGHALLLQPDGEIVVAGSNVYRHAPETAREPWTSLVRFNTDGLLDPSFGDGGVADGPSFEVQHIYERHGRLLLVGPSGYTVAPDKPTSVWVDQGVGIQTLTADGAPLGSGTRWLPMPLPVVDAQLDRSGRTVAVANNPGDLPGTPGGIVMRFLPNGTRDPTFGSRGLALLRSDQLLGLTVQADDSVLVVGSTEASELFLARLTRTGKLDTSFGTKHGMTVLPEGLGLSPSGAIAVADNHIFVAIGQNLSPHGEQLQLVRFTARGRLERSFGHDGIATNILSTGSQVPWDVEPKAIAFDHAGDPVVAGTESVPCDHCFPEIEPMDTRWFLARYTHLGRDCSFGGKGIVLDESRGSAMAVSVQPNGRIVVAGDHEQELMAARYMDGAAPHTCPGEGKIRLPRHKGRREHPKRR